MASQDPWVFNGTLGKKSIGPNEILATASAPSRIPLTSRKAAWGVDLGKNEFSSPATNITMFNNYRREDNCRTDLMVRAGRPPRAELKVLPSQHGVGRHQSSIFPRAENNGALLTPTDSRFVERPNKLGLPK
jgi:hypothetical protein